MNNNNFKSSVNNLITKNVPFIKAGHFIFLSNYLDIKDSDSLIDNPKEQIQQTYRKFDETLKLAGITRDDVVKITMNISDIEHLNYILDLRNKFFINKVPAMTILINKCNDSVRILNITGIAYNSN